LGFFGYLFHRDFNVFVDFFSYVGGILPQCLPCLFPRLRIPNLDITPRIHRILPQKPTRRIRTPNLRHQPCRDMGLLQLSRPGIQVFAFVVLHDRAEGDVTRVVVDASPAAGEDVVFVEVGDGSALSRVDHDTGWGDGSSFGTWHFCCFLC